jgi:hypothetical protein
VGEHARTKVSYPNAEAQKRLLSVAREAWPFLSEEWERLVKAEPNEENRYKRSTIEVCWESVSEERCLGLLATHVLEKRDYSMAHAVEAISRVGHGMVAEADAAFLDSYFKKMQAWWSEYRPNWEQTIRTRYGEVPRLK